MKLGRGWRVFFTRIGSQTLTGFLPLISALHEGRRAQDWQLFGGQKLISLFRGVKYRFGKKFMPYSIYSFESQERLLGVKRDNLIENLSRRPNFLEIFFSLDHYLQTQHANSYESDVNDAGLRITAENHYRDENIEIMPILSTSPL